MNTSQHRAWIALHRIPELTDKTFRRLIVERSEPESIFSLSPEALAAYGVTANAQHEINRYRDRNRLLSDRNLQQDFKTLDRMDINVIALSNPEYPELLKQISDPPPLLYVRGKLSLLNTPQLAIVGSRKPTHQGSENAFRFAKELAVAGFTITSGMALGIDSKCHQGALACSGDTVAVLGTGIDRIYPASNHTLHSQILLNGTIVSEFPLGSAPLAYHFPRRNRVISGLSLGLLVVEAAIKSGSLISARCALDQNREVFAVPGSIHNTASRGCHALIREGAKLAETALDIVEELKGWTLTYNRLVNNQHCHGAEQQMQQSTSMELDSGESYLLALLGYDPQSMDILLQRSGWTTAELSAKLTSLKIKGLVENMSGIYQRIS